MTETLTGWLLDVYPNETNLTVWLIGDDGRRQRFVQDFTPALYAAGPSPRLRQLWIWLKAQEIPVRLSRTERRDVLAGQADTINPTPGPAQPAASLLDPPVLRTSPHDPGKEGAGAGRQTQPPGQSSAT